MTLEKGKTIRIDFAQTATREEFHRLLAEKLGFPPYYGNNLDALYDCLTDISAPLTLILRNPDTLGTYGNAAVSAMQAAAEENPLLQVILQ